jgi:hypothetical protein
MTITEQRDQKAEPIRIKSDTNTSIIIEQKEVDIAHKILGCFNAMDGNENEQNKYLKDKSSQFGRRLYNTSLTRKQAHVA